MGAYELDYGPDTTPPEVNGASLLDSVTLKIFFSESLEVSSAENESNYSISNNVNIFNASLSGSEVTLQTSVHSLGIYTITVSNVTDLAGNIISQQANSAQYEMSYLPPTELIKLEINDVTASTIPQPDHHPDKTIDNSGYYHGDPDSRWAGDTMPEWLNFDLGVVKNVSRTKLEFYNWHIGRIYDYSIQISLDGTNWTTILSHLSSNTEQWTINDFNTEAARFIKIIFHSSNQNDWAGLWECEIWGYNLTSANTPEIPSENFTLCQNYPNPFNPTTNIQFKISARTKVVLKVFNSIGQEVSELINTYMDKGTYKIEFNALNLTSGIYFYQMIAGEFVDTKKMILLR
jgi:hypothetical protein